MKRICLAVILGFFLIFTGCSSGMTGNAVKDDVIKIGFIGPLTGDGLSYGMTEKNAVEIAVEEINSKGGVNGKRLEVIYENGECSGKTSSLAATKLIDVDNVKVILGGACSGETLAAAPIAEKNKVILFSAFSGNAKITDAGDYVFRNAPSDADAGPATAKYAISRYKNIAVITENTDYALGLREHFKESFKDLGGEIVSDEIFRPEERDFRTYILKATAEDPDAIFVNPQTGITGGLLTKQIKEMGIETPVITNFVGSGADYNTQAGDDAEGVVFIDVPSLSDSEEADRLMEKYIERYNKEPESDYEMGSRYDSVYIIKRAIEKHGLDTEKIKDYLYSIKVHGVIGDYSFDDNGDVVGIKWIAKEIRDGEIITLGEVE